MKPVTVRDQIAFLQQFPMDMEIWCTWDESGEYWPCTVPQGRIDRVVFETRDKCKKRFRESYVKNKGKKVLVLLKDNSPMLQMNVENDND